MASDTPEPDQTATDGAPPECSPCRGTGQVISGLGGVQSTIECPWCEGTGHFIPDHDAQAHFRPEGAEAPAGPAVD